ncbi:MAG: hypothetical protein R6U17_03810 [Thermoplasmata archaeon]
MSLLNLPKGQKNILELLSLKNRSLTELSTQLDMSKAGALKHLDSLIGDELIRKEMIINEKGIYLFSQQNNLSLIRILKKIPRNLNRFRLAFVRSEERKTKENLCFVKGFSLP